MKTLLRTLTGGSLALLLGLSSHASAVYEYDIYSGASCHPEWGNSTSGGRGSDGVLYNNKTTEIEYTCPLITRDGTDWHYDDVIVHVLDGSSVTNVSCRVLACDSAGACIVSSTKSSSGTGSATIQWIDAFSSSWQSRSVGVSCKLPAHGDPGGGISKIFSVIGEKDD